MKSNVIIILLMSIFGLIGCSEANYTKNWSAGNDMPTARSEMTSTLLNGKIYVIGGIRLWGSTDKVEAYDVKNNTWEKLPRLPKKLNHIGIASDGEKIYVSGGFLNMRQTDFANTLYAFNVKSKSWSSLAEMPDSRGAHFMIFRKGQLHLFGGRQHKEVWTYSIDSNTWKEDEITPIPELRDHINVLQDENHLYIVGGRQSGKVKAACWQYNFESRKWTTFSHIPTARGGQTAALINKQIHIIGGEDLNTSTTFSEHNVYDLSSDTWQINNNLPTARHGLTSEIYNGKWYIIGGGKQAGVKTLISASDQVEIFEF